MEQKISLYTAVLMIMNIMIGSGILIGPGGMAAIAGNASFLGWPLVALLFLPIVLCMVQLSAMFPGAGGFYLYTKEGLNKHLGFLAGWAYVWGYTFAIAVEIIALRQILLTTGIHGFFIDHYPTFVVLATILCAGINLLSLRAFSLFLNSLTISKLLPLIILIALLPFMFNTSFSVSSTELAMLPLALPWAIFGFFGFEYACSMTHLIQDGEKNGPKAILIGFLGTSVLYMLFHFGLLNIMGPQALAADGASAFAQFITLPLPFIVTFLNILIPLASILTLFAGANGMLNANALILHAMASDNLFIRSDILLPITKSYRPWAAILVQSVVALCLMLILPNVNLVGGLCNTGILLSFVLPLVSLFVLQTNKRQWHKRSLTIAALLVVAALVLYSIYRLGGTMGERLFFTLPFIAIVLAGLLVMRRDR